MRFFPSSFFFFFICFLFFFLFFVFVLLLLRLVMGVFCVGQLQTVNRDYIFVLVNYTQ